MKYLRDTTYEHDAKTMFGVLEAWKQSGFGGQKHSPAVSGIVIVLPSGVRIEVL
ncbi:MAG: hypothetical protein HYX66_04630 [Ignavibacteria bacterium]|nr:hypothetical protein [Ignavibacteria bacterium]